MTTQNTKQTIAGIPVEEDLTLRQPSQRIMDEDTILIDKDIYFSIMSDLYDTLNDSNGELLAYIKTQAVTAEVRIGDKYIEGSNLINISITKCSPDASHYHIILWIPNDDSKHMELGLIDANDRLKGYHEDDYPTSLEATKRKIADINTGRNYEASPQPEHRTPTNNDEARQYYIQQIAAGKEDMPTLDSMLESMERNPEIKLMMLLTSLSTNKSVEQLIEEELADVARKVEAARSLGSTAPGSDTIH